MYVGVSNLKEGTVTATMIAVMWNDTVSSNGCGPAFYHNVTAVNLMDPSDMISMQTSHNVAEFSNLRSDMSYNISVAAVNRAGTGPLSMITVTTLTFPGM